jgi:hypothetical protein
MPNIAERLKRVEGNIVDSCGRSGRCREDVKFVVVTKTADVEQIKEVIGLGYHELGENRVQRLGQVSREIGEYLSREDGEVKEVNWHMIGHLQRNKVKSVLGVCSLVHSVDTLRLAEEINSAAKKRGIRADVLLQVNCSEEPQKYGVPVGAAIHLAEQMMTMGNICLRGLMTMAPLTRDSGVVRSCFVRARELFEEIGKEGDVGAEFKELSMGMSQDYEIAIEEGATILRIGSAIFAG